MYVTLEPPLAPEYGTGGGVGGDDAHLVGGQAERLRGDRGEARVHAAHVHRRGDDSHRSVLVDAADGRGRLGAARPVARGESHALSVGERVARLPERMLADALEHLDRAHARERVPADADVVLDDGVSQSELERIEAELRSELVQQRLEREGRGRSARARGTHRT